MRELFQFRENPFAALQHGTSHSGRQHAGRAAIEQRLKAPAEGDFVIAFYNPVSQRRRTQLAAAKEILLQHRPATAPVILARNLGRDGETVTVTELAKLEIDAVDMLTLVIVGSSETKAVERPDGGVWVYTPRGYAAKNASKESLEQQAS